MPEPGHSKRTAANAKPEARGGAPSVLIVMGVSGSGKTTIAGLLSNRLGWTCEDGDRFHPPANVAKMAAGIPLTDEDRWPWLLAIADWIDATRNSGRHGVIACSALKREYRAVLVGDRGDAVRLVFLKGDRELIKARLALREGHFMPPELLDSQFAALEPPGEDERPLTVSIDARPREIVDMIIHALETDLGASLPAGP
jgi:gluconokinase